MTGPLLPSVQGRIRSRESRRTSGAVWRPVLVALLLVLSLAPRLVGPAGGVPPRDGYVAICAGAQVIYIRAEALGLDGEDGNDPASIGDSCPWFFYSHAVDPTVIAFAVPAIGAWRVAPLPAVHDFHVPAASQPFLARGPPATFLFANSLT